MENYKEVIITEYSNVTNEGVVLHLNEPAKLKTGQILSKEFFVSWDKIGQALFENYTEKCEVADRRELRQIDKTIKP